MTPDEFLAALIAIHRYISEKERPMEIKEVPLNWKMTARLSSSLSF